MSTTYTSRTLALVRPYLRPLMVAALLAVVVAACRGALVWLVRDVLDGLLATGDARARWLLPAAIVGLFAIQGAARAWRTWLTRAAAIDAEASLRQRLFERLLRSSPARLSAAGVGDRLSRLSHDAGKVRTAMGAAVTVVQRPLSALALLIAAGTLAPSLFVWSLVGLPVVMWVVIWTGRRTRASSLAHAESLGAMESLARDALRGIRSVQAHGAERAVAASFGDANGQQVAAALATTRYRVVGPPLVELAGAAGVAAVIGLGSVEVAQGTLSAGALVGFLVALGMLNEPLKGFAVAHGLWSEAQGALTRVFEELDAPLPIREREGAAPWVGPLTGLTLQGVSVDRGRGLVLDDVSVALKPGEIVVLQGVSGAGKSTLLDVIAGYCSYSGVVSWSGTDAQDLTLASRRAAIALADQDPWVGVGSIVDAVRLGRPGASLADVRSALVAAGFTAQDGLFESLAAGVQSPVGDGGNAVSGGERQRIALARAVVRAAPLVLLDEPTAHLDPAAEKLFLETLARLSPGRIILLVTHRPTPADFADRVLRLEDGRLREVPSRRAHAS